MERLWIINILSAVDGSQFEGILSFWPKWWGNVHPLIYLNSLLFSSLQRTGDTLDRSQILHRGTHRDKFSLESCSFVFLHKLRRTQTIIFSRLHWICRGFNGSPISACIDLVTLLCFIQRSISRQQIISCQLQIKETQQDRSERIKRLTQT